MLTKQCGEEIGTVMKLKSCFAALLFSFISQAAVAQCGPYVSHKKQSTDEIAKRQLADPTYAGTVLVTTVVSDTGRVLCADVSQSVSRDLDKRAVEAVRKYTFAPAKKDGKPVTVQVLVAVDFVSDPKTGQITMKPISSPGEKSK